MSFDDAEEARLDERVQELLEDATLEQLETQMLRYFGTLDINEMPEGRVKRAIVFVWFNRLAEASDALLTACEQNPDLWEAFSPDFRRS